MLSFCNYPSEVNFMEKKKITSAIRCSLENFSRLENDGIDIIPLYALSNLFRD